jgi:glyoxylase-like metal-dependent hydrolase (beta-lactamase superfamily II)
MMPDRFIYKGDHASTVMFGVEWPANVPVEAPSEAVAAKLRGNAEFMAADAAPRRGRPPNARPEVNDGD